MSRWSMALGPWTGSLKKMIWVSNRRLHSGHPWTMDMGSGDRMVRRGQHLPSQAQNTVVGEVR